MAVGVRGHRRRRVALGVGVPVVLVLALAQVLLPGLAAKRVSARVARYGTVKSVHVSAWPAIELLWGKADSVDLRVGSFTATPAQMVAQLWEARGVNDMTVSVDTATFSESALPRGLTIGNLRTTKHGTAIHTSATFTQSQLDAALPSGVQIEPTASGGGEVEAHVSGGLFGLQASISALVRPVDGRLIAEPRGLPFGGLATITLFEDPHLKINAVGITVSSRSPLTYRLSLTASLT
ncbi:MAG: hypothetical protein WBQ21_14955 [Solirubrobacteraceae bacterium]